VLTPRATVEAIQAGYRPLVHLPALPESVRDLIRRYPVPGSRPLLRCTTTAPHRDTRSRLQGGLFGDSCKLFTLLRVPHQERFKRRRLPAT
jgi:hypothetical protein